MDKQLSSGDLARVCGVTTKVVNKLQQFGVLVPRNSAIGKGHHCIFGVEHAVALMFAQKWKNEVVKISPSFYTSLLINVTALGVEGMQKEFAAGRTYLMDVPELRFGVPLPARLYNDMYDLKLVYDEVVERIAEVENEIERPKGSGRRTLLSR